MAVATGLSTSGVPFWAAAAPGSVAEALSAEFLSVELLSADLPSSAFAVSFLLSLERDAWVLPSEPAALLSSAGPRLDESVERLGGVGSVAAVVSRGDLSFAVSLAERVGWESCVWLGAGEGSGWMLLSTIEAKLSLTCDGSRLTGLAGALA
jgi:hypothetical protein